MAIGKAIFASAVMMVSAAVSAPAIASTSAPDPVEVPLTQSSDGTSWSGTFSTNNTPIPQGDFTLTDLFELPNSGDAGTSFNTTASALDKSGDVDFTSATFNGEAVKIDNSNDSFEYGYSGTKSVQSGTQKLVINGYSYGNGVVAGTFSATVAPVPETATWAMAVIGFGAAGATLRRRRRDSGIRTVFA